MLTLYYGILVIGWLKKEDEIWEFKYSSDFQDRPDLRPLVQFPDKTKTYKSKRLYPYFLERIPNLKSAKIQAEMKKHGIASDDLFELLRLFGKRTIKDPFDLVYEET